MRKLSFRSTGTFSASQKEEKSSVDGDKKDTDKTEKNNMLNMMQIGDTQHHFTRNGRLVANKQLIYKIDKEEGIQSVSK